MPEPRLDRRRFLLACSAAAVLPGRRQEPAAAAPPRFRKAVKLSMVQGGSLAERFALVKEVGFDGVEIDSPNDLRADEVLAARDATGIPIHGVIDSVHWNDRLSHADTAVRAKGLAALERALRDAKAYGASSVLLVPGRVGPGERYDQVYERSQAEVRKALPLARELGVPILIENVWNGFLLSPLEFARYVDELDPKREIVGVYFDVSNYVKYAEPADWIRILGRRIRKVDCKGYSRKKGWCKIGEGDEDWPEVVRALREIGYCDYSGWVTAEVEAGDRQWLADVKGRLDRVLGAGR